jgi:hypothetical protein
MPDTARAEVEHISLVAANWRSVFADEGVRLFDQGQSRAAFGLPLAGDQVLALPDTG